MVHTRGVSVKRTYASFSLICEMRCEPLNLFDRKYISLSLSFSFSILSPYSSVALTVVADATLYIIGLFRVGNPGMVSGIRSFFNVQRRFDILETRQIGCIFCERS